MKLNIPNNEFSRPHYIVVSIGSSVIYFLKYLFILEREEGREKEKEKHRSVVSCMHADQGPTPQPRHVP